MEIANEFYTDIYGIGIYYHDASIDPVFSCFAGYDCNAPVSGTEAPEDLDSTVDVPYGCRSFMVPYGTSVKVYDGDGNSGAFAPVGDFVYIDGQKPINEYGELTCHNAYDYLPDLDNGFSAFHTLYRNIEGEIDVSYDKLSNARRAIGSWRELVSG